jgi:hypothetical protein
MHWVAIRLRLSVKTRLSKAGEAPLIQCRSEADFVDCGDADDATIHTPTLAVSSGSSSALVMPAERSSRRKPGSPSTGVGSRL